MGLVGARTTCPQPGFSVQLAVAVDGVFITCSQPLVHQAHEKKTQHSWMFDVRSEVRGRGLGSELPPRTSHPCL